MKSQAFSLGMLLMTMAASQGGSYQEEFAEDPLSQGWSIHGDPDLFQWNPADQRLAVTWDSARSNSYFHRPLGGVLTEKDSFGLEFDLLLTSVEVGHRPGKPFTFELAVGFHLLQNATGAGFRRGTGRDASHLLEWDYFPAQGVVASTISPTAISRDGVFATSFNFPFDLPLHQWMHIALDYSGEARKIRASVSFQGQPMQPVEDVLLPESFDGFQLDAVAISSYSDEGAGGSLLATGQIDNLRVTTPEQPMIQIRPGETQGEIYAWVLKTTASHRFYLERTLDFKQWSTITSEDASGEIPVLMIDNHSPAGKAFYRVRAERL